jgi:hypothetical protein
LDIFEILVDGKILRICTKVIYAGHLGKLLDKFNFFNKELALRDSICLIGNDKHGCSFRYDVINECWAFYNPDNQNGELLFKSEKDFQSEILRVLGNDLSIIYAFFDMSCGDNCGEELIHQFACELVRDLGLFLIAHYAPYQLAALFDLARNDADLRCAMEKTVKLVELRGNRDTVCSC